MKQVTVDTASDLVYYAVDEDDLITEITGITYDEVTVNYYKEGDVGWTNKVMTGADLNEIGDGVYRIGFSALELDTLGSFIYRVISTVNDAAPYIKEVDVVSETSSVVAVDVDSCSIWGHIVALDTTPFQDAAVSANLVSVPEVLNLAGISSTIISVKTNSEGYFIINLPRLAMVTITIPSINYIRTITVPSVASKNLFEVEG